MVFGAPHFKPACWARSRLRLGAEPPLFRQECVTEHALLPVYRDELCRDTKYTHLYTHGPLPIKIHSFRLHNVNRILHVYAQAMG